MSKAANGSRVIVTIAGLLLAGPAMAVDWPVYTLGGAETIVRALNGLAMVFGTSLFRNGFGDGIGAALGFGQVFGVGLLFSVLVMSLSGIIYQRVPADRLLVMVIGYAILFVPTIRVTVHDLQAGTTQAVDNVPLGIGLPVSITGMLANRVTDMTTVAFTPPDAVVSSVNAYDVREGGFMSPLKSLLQLRAIQPCLDPTLCRSVADFARYCTSDANGRSINWASALRKPDSITDVFVTQGSTISGTTIVYSDTDPTGTAQSCSQAGAAISTRLLAQADAVHPSSALNSILAASADSVRTAAQSTSMQSTMTATGLQQMIGNSAFDTQTNMANMLACNIMNAASAAAGASSVETAYQAIMTETMEQWKTDSAGEASVFTKTVFTTVNVLLFLFIALSPIVVMVGVAMGMEGFGLYAKYALFGAWTQSWLPIAAGVNAYIMIDFTKKIKDFLATIGGVDGAYAITCQTVQPFYEQISTALASASTMLASSGTIALAIMTGSTFALAGIAAKASGGSGYVDEKRWTGSSIDTTNATAPVAAAQRNGFNIHSAGSSYEQWAETPAESAVKARTTSTSGSSGGSASIEAGKARTASTAYSAAVSKTGQLAESYGKDFVAAASAEQSTGLTKDQSVTASRGISGSSGQGASFDVGKNLMTDTSLSLGLSPGNVLKAVAAAMKGGKPTEAAMSSPMAQQIVKDLQSGKINDEQANQAYAKLVALDNMAHAGKDPKTATASAVADAASKILDANMTARTAATASSGYSARDSQDFQQSGGSQQSQSVRLGQSQSAGTSTRSSQSDSLTASRTKLAQAKQEEGFAEQNVIKATASASQAFIGGSGTNQDILQTQQLMMSKGGPIAGQNLANAVSAGIGEMQREGYSPPHANAAAARLQSAYDTRGSTRDKVAAVISTAASMLGSGDATEVAAGARVLSSISQSNADKGRSDDFAAIANNARTTAALNASRGNADASAGNPLNTSMGSTIGAAVAAAGQKAAAGTSTLASVSQEVAAGTAAIKAPASVVADKAAQNLGGQFSTAAPIVASQGASNAAAAQQGGSTAVGAGADVINRAPLGRLNSTVDKVASGVGAISGALYQVGDALDQRFGEPTNLAPNPARTYDGSSSATGGLAPQTGATIAKEVFGGGAAAAPVVNQEPSSPNTTRGAPPLTGTVRSEPGLIAREQASFSGTTAAAVANQGAPIPASSASGSVRTQSGLVAQEQRAIAGGQSATSQDDPGAPPDPKPSPARRQVSLKASTCFRCNN